MNENNFNVEENQETTVNNNEVKSETTDTNMLKPKKNNKNIIYILIITLLIIGFGLYICIDKGLIFKNNDEPKKNEKKQENKTNVDKGEKKDSNEKSENNNVVSSNYDLTIHSNCKSVQDTIEGPKIESCELNKYKYTIKNEKTGDSWGKGTVSIYNENNTLIASYSYDETSLNNKSNFRYALNSDGSVSVITTCENEPYHISCNYERYDYNGNKINVNNYKKVVKLIDNYLLVMENMHLKLYDFNGNQIKNFDIDVSNMTYGGIFDCSGWLSNNTVKDNIFIGAQESKTTGKYVEIYYFYDPSTGNISTKELEVNDQYSCSLLVDNQ